MFKIRDADDLSAAAECDLNGPRWVAAEGTARHRDTLDYLSEAEQCEYACKCSTLCCGGYFDHLIKNVN